MEKKPQNHSGSTGDHRTDELLERLEELKVGLGANMRGIAEERGLTASQFHEWPTEGEHVPDGQAAMIAAVREEMWRELRSVSQVSFNPVTPQVAPKARGLKTLGMRHKKWLPVR